MDTEILKIPAVALRGMVILPGMIAHFDISRDRSIRAIEQCMICLLYTSGVAAAVGLER